MYKCSGKVISVAKRQDLNRVQDITKYLITESCIFKQKEKYYFNVSALSH